MIAKHNGMAAIKDLSVLLFCPGVVADNTPCTSKIIQSGANLGLGRLGSCLGR